MSATTATRVEHLRAGRTSIPFTVLALGAAVVLGCGAARWSHYASAPVPEKTLATVSLNFADGQTAPSSSATPPPAP